LVAGDRPALPEGTVAGFWIRMGSDLLDALVLGVVGLLAAVLFRDTALRLGERAALFGAGLTLVYTGILQSDIGGGQTLGKRLLGLRVFRLDGRYLSLDRSLVRWSIMGTMCYGGAIAYALGSVAPFFKGYALAAALGGTQLALFLGCGLLVPFHPLKRGLHDLLTGSVVIRRGRVPVELVKRLDNRRRDRVIVIAGIAVAVLGTILGLVGLRSLPASLEPLTRVSAAMTAMGIENPGVVDSFEKGPNGSTHRIIATGYLPTGLDGAPRVDNAEERILASIRKEMPLEGVDALVIHLRKGVNLGVYSSYSYTNRVEPAVAANAAQEGTKEGTQEGTQEGPQEASKEASK
jgi:uncharacterized RDD family membrane protein YckC